MSAETAAVVKKRQFSLVWLLPVLALFLAIWMVLQAELNQGPLITVVFQSAEGVEAGKTKLKCRSVEIGIVEDVSLNDNFTFAEVQIRVEKEFEPLLRTDSQLWIVKPRVGGGRVSGIGTVLSGSYIELLPGISSLAQSKFIGLEEPPVFPAVGNGKRIRLVSDDAKSLNVGNPVLYKGFEVGIVERANFNSETRNFEYGVYIEEEYADIVCTSTRFWNDSGIEVNLSADGLSLNTGSVESIITGGVSFDIPEGVGPGVPCEPNEEYYLYDNYAAVLDQPYNYAAEYILLFDTSVRGLKRGAPVEYRGMQAGTVVDISFDYLPEDRMNIAERTPVPVLIRIDPGRMQWGDTPEGVEMIRQLMPEWVELGVHATLATGNLLTGAMYIAFDYDDEEGHEHNRSIGKLGDYDTLPTVSSGFDQIERKLTQLLDKLNDLQLEKALEDMETTLVDISTAADAAKVTLAGVDAILQDEETRQLPVTLNTTAEELQALLRGFNEESPIYKTLTETMDEIRKAAANLERYSNTLNTKPNSLIFSGSQNRDPEPEDSP